MADNSEWHVLELFSGIGGMHEALKISGKSFQIKAAVDINEMANIVYNLNHPGVDIWNRNIQSITVDELTGLKIDTIVLSPPCQPFSRQGKQKDVDDPRTDGFLSICSNLIEQLDGLKRILMENVKGFEESEAQRRFTDVLKRSGFHFQEFLLSPGCIGIPNSRTRYFCIARKSLTFPFEAESILEEIPGLEKTENTNLSDYIEENVNESFLIPRKKLLKHCWVYDIVTPASQSTNCFTKAYGHFARGTGSVFCPNDTKLIEEIFIRIREEIPENEKITELKRLQLRYFTPREIERLMGFENTLKYPELTTNRQKYKLLGNSLNVKIVAELLKLL